MGTRFELVLSGRDEAHARAAAEEALGVIEECDGRYSRFRSDSLVARINREAGSAALRLDPQSFELLERCAHFQRATDGAFDVCVGAPMDRLRGGPLRGDSENCGEAGGFELDARELSLRFTRPGTQLDLGGIAKGHALDLAAAALAAAGIEVALLHGGTSSVIALGAPPAQPEGWGVDLGAAFGGAQAQLCRRALSLSALRVPQAGVAPDVDRAHILDPRGGGALRGEARAAVSLPSARDAEAWSTALLVLARRPAGLQDGLHALDLPADFECLVADPRRGVFSHTASGFDAFRRLPSAESSTAR